VTRLMPKSKLSALLSLLLVFVSGTVLGAFAYRLYMVKSVSSSVLPPSREGIRRPDPEEIRKRVVAEMHDQLKLDGQQLVRLNEIYDDTRERSDQVRKKANAEMRTVWDHQVEEIKAMLRPDQVAAYDKLRARHDAERKQRKQNGPQGERKGPPPPPDEKH